MKKQRDFVIVKYYIPVINEVFVKKYYISNIFSYPFYSSNNLCYFIDFNHYKKDMSFYIFWGGDALDV